MKKGINVPKSFCSRFSLFFLEQHHVDLEEKKESHFLWNQLRLNLKSPTVR